MERFGGKRTFEWPRTLDKARFEQKTDGRFDSTSHQLSGPRDWTAQFFFENGVWSVLHLSSSSCCTFDIAYLAYMSLPYWSLPAAILVLSCLVERGSSVGRMPDSQSREPGSNPRCYRFEVWAFSFTSRRLSRLSCRPYK